VLAKEMTKPGFSENGDITQMENSEEFVGEKEMPTERKSGMSAKGTKKSSLGTKKPMKHGEEPKEILLAIIWSAVETLLARGEARLFTGKGEVAIVLARTSKTDDGLVPTLSADLEEKVLAIGGRDEITL
jgi:hypothetical protein